MMTREDVPNELPVIPVRQTARALKSEVLAKAEAYAKNNTKPWAVTVPDIAVDIRMAKNAREAKQLGRNWKKLTRSA